MRMRPSCSTQYARSGRISRQRTHLKGYGHSLCGPPHILLDLSLLNGALIVNTAILVVDYIEGEANSYRRIVICEKTNNNKSEVTKTFDTGDFVTDYNNASKYLYSLRPTTITMASSSLDNFLMEHHEFEFVSKHAQRVNGTYTEMDRIDFIIYLANTLKTAKARINVDPNYYKLEIQFLLDWIAVWSENSDIGEYIRNVSGELEVLESYIKVIRPFVRNKMIRELQKVFNNRDYSPYTTENV